MITTRRVLLAALMTAAAPLPGPEAFAAPAVSVEVYEDFLCPFCAAFDQQYGSDLANMARSSRAKVHYRFVNKLDDLSASGDYSTRAAGAARCVANLAPERKDAFRSQLFSPDVQPEEDGDEDLSNSDLAEIATETGAGAATACVRQGAQVASARAEAATALAKLEKAGGRGVPSVVKNGKLVDLDDPDWLANLAP